MRGIHSHEIYRQEPQKCLEVWQLSATNILSTSLQQYPVSVVYLHHLPHRLADTYSILAPQIYLRKQEVEFMLL